MKNNFETFYQQCQLIARDLDKEISFAEAQKLFKNFQGGNSEKFIRACLSKKSAAKSDDYYKIDVRKFFQKVPHESQVNLYRGEWVKATFFRSDDGRIKLEYHKDGYLWCLTEWQIFESLQNKTIKLLRAK